MLVSASILAVDRPPGMPGPDEFVPFDAYPEMTHKEIPEYPSSAARLGVGGTVWIKALVDTQGSVVDVVVHKTSGADTLDRAALRAARKCRFEPAQFQGEAIAMWVAFPTEFIFDKAAAQAQNTANRLAESEQETADN